MTPNGDGPRHLVLVGEMATGKTSVGSSLAARLDMGFTDSDAVLEDLTGSTGHQISARSGVESLHDLELQSLAIMLAGSTPSVVAAAASVIDSAEGRRLLAPHLVVWLTASPDVIPSRLDDSVHRRTTTPGERSTLLERREGFYEAVADFRLDTTDMDPVEAAKRIASWLRKETS